MRAELELAEPDIAAEHATPRVLLVGNPNTGKTSLFNVLAGVRAKTANYPGITVDFRQAEIAIGPSRSTDREASVLLVDLPGMYSLQPVSPEEAVAADQLRSDVTAAAIVIVVDATNLARNLVLVSEILELNRPTLVAVNLIDVAESAGIDVDTQRLESQLHCPVIAVSARSGKGLDRLKAKIGEIIAPQPAALPIARTSCVAGCHGCQMAARFHWAGGVDADCVHGETRVPGQIGWLDRWLTSPLAGLFSLAAVMLLVFFLIFSMADLPMSAIETGFGWLGEQVAAVLPTEISSPLLWFPLAATISMVMFAGGYWLGEIAWNRKSATIAVLISVLVGSLPIEDFRSLLIDGVIGGIAGVVVFLPQICILFFFITLLEDSGYMARGALVMERIMRRVGLPGKAFVPMLSAHACAIPGIMATRTIESWRDRLVTILVLPLLTCSARLPVYAMVATLLFGNRPLQAALVFAGAYLLGLVAALVTAWCLKKTVVPGDVEPMILELPPYRIPSLRNALMTVWDRAHVFLRQAGSIILLIAVVLWAMATYPKLPADAGYADDLTRSQAALEYSLAGLRRALGGTRLPATRVRLEDRRGDSQFVRRPRSLGVDVVDRVWPGRRGRRGPSGIGRDVAPAADDRRDSGLYDRQQSFVIGFLRLGDAMFADAGGHQARDGQLEMGLVPTRLHDPARLRRRPDHLSIAVMVRSRRVGRNSHLPRRNNGERWLGFAKRPYAATAAVSACRRDR